MNKFLRLVLMGLLAWSAPGSAQQAGGSKAAELYQSALNQMSGGAQTRDAIRAVEDLRESARLGYAPAQTAMVFYAASQEEAAGFCKKAAEQGDALGEWCLGRAYFLGEGVQKDWINAEGWLRKASDQGNPFAEYIMGLIQEDRDPKAAPAWFQRAAEQGLPQAQQKLGRLLREGRNIATDKYQAYVWLLASVELGAPDVADIGSLESDLGSTAVNKAKAEARELAQKTSRASTAHGCTGWDGEFSTPPSLPPLEVQKYCR